jgi:hypothetical protein
MYGVLFKNFETRQQAEEFARWYEGQGEQDIGFWFEEAGLPTPYTKTITSKENLVVVELL